MLKGKISKIDLAKQKIAALTQHTKENKTKAFFQLLTSFGPFVLLWVLMYKALDYSYLITFLLGVVNAFFLVRIFIIQHDCGHRSFLKNTRLRNAVGYACSFLSTIPYKYWSSAHQVHHTNNGKLELRDIGDLPTMTVEEYAQASKIKQFLYRIYRSPFVLFGLVPLFYMLINIRLPLINLVSFKKKTWPLMLFNMLMLIGLAGCIYVFDALKFILTHGTVVGLFSIIAIWFFYVQHQHEKAYKHWAKNWDYLTSALKGSTYYKLPGIFRWLTGNIGLHHLHHLNPAIPNYNLKKCLDQNSWINRHATIITFWQSLKLMQNKLWDEATERMITFREFYALKRLGYV